MTLMNTKTEKNVFNYLAVALAAAIAVVVF